MATWTSYRRSADGFSLIELMIAIVLAGIVLAGMLPLFASALKRTSGDEFRVASTNIAQDRVEQVRLLTYADITADNLNDPASGFGDERFGHDYSVVGESRPYHIDYVVNPPASATARQKYIKVSVSREGSDFVTTADTVIKNPEPGGATLTEGEPTNLSMTVYFDNYTYVKSPGVVIRRVQTNVTPHATTTPTPASQMPSSGHQSLTWTGLIGGPNYTYTIFCHSTKAGYVLQAPPFRLWKSGKLKFDTYPGGD
jgi:prepilin-type N-terminal cleavage/methylation domain-containing protein